MEVTINNQNHFLEEACSIEHMLNDLAVQTTNGLAVAVNQTIVPKSSWPVHTLQPGDQIILIKATQGG